MTTSSDLGSRKKEHGQVTGHSEEFGVALKWREVQAAALADQAPTAPTYQLLRRPCSVSGSSMRKKAIDATSLFLPFFCRFSCFCFFFFKFFQEAIFLQPAV